MVKRYVPQSDGFMQEASPEGYESMPRYVYEGDYAALESRCEKQGKEIMDLHVKLFTVYADYEKAAGKRYEAAKDG